MKIVSHFLTVCCLLMLGCNNSTSHSQGVDTDTDMPEKLEKAIIHTNQSEATSLSMEELEAWFPKTLNGMNLTQTMPGALSRSGISSMAAGYDGADSKKFVPTITDCAGPQSSLARTAYNQIEQQPLSEKTTDFGYEHVVNEQGFHAKEMYHDASQMLEIQFLYKDRIGVSVQAYNMARDEVWQTIKSLPLDKLLNK